MCRLLGTSTPWGHGESLWSLLIMVVNLDGLSWPRILTCSPPSDRHMSRCHMSSFFCCGPQGEKGPVPPLPPAVRVVLKEPVFFFAKGCP